MYRLGVWGTVKDPLIKQKIFNQHLPHRILGLVLHVKKLLHLICFLIFNLLGKKMI